MLNIVWFKRDLRAHDHGARAQAVATGGPVLPIFIAQPALWAQPDMSAWQWAFVATCLGELRKDLTALGQLLVVRVGDAVEIFEDVRRRDESTLVDTANRLASVQTHEPSRLPAQSCAVAA